MKATKYEPTTGEKDFPILKAEKSKYKIFVVEDSDIFRELISRFVEDIDSREFIGKNDKIEIESFRSGEDCLKAISKKPDIVLLDYYLDDNTGEKELIDGLETLKQIKKYSPKSKIIAVTSQGDLWVSTQFYLWGASDYISKGPGIREKIQKSVKNMLRMIDAEDALRRKNKGLDLDYF
jgi:CheY-like chemotaxis protein